MSLLNNSPNNPNKRTTNTTRQPAQPTPAQLPRGDDHKDWIYFAPAEKEGAVYSVHRSIRDISTFIDTQLKLTSDSPNDSLCVLNCDEDDIKAFCLVFNGACNLIVQLCDNAKNVQPETLKDIPKVAFSQPALDKIIDEEIVRNLLRVLDNFTDAQLARAANIFEYLQLADDVISLIAKVISNRWSGKSVEELRESLGQIDDFTEDRRKEVQEMTAWCYVGLDQ